MNSNQRGLQYSSIVNVALVQQEDGQNLHVPLALIVEILDRTLVTLEIASHCSFVQGRG